MASAVGGIPEVVVDGETADLAYEKTLERLDHVDITEEQFRNEMATLTLGSGAAAMVLARAELARERRATAAA